MTRALSRGRWAFCLFVFLVGGSCGGGGGGGSGASGAGGAASPAVAFLGFGFRFATGTETSAPPMEDVSAIPPTLGASLNTQVLFEFDGVPDGPFNVQTLPVYTTPVEVTPAAGAPAGVPRILAKGSYSLEVDAGIGRYTVVFSPFVPTAPLQLSLSSDPAAVPGLLPASTYTASVSVAPNPSLGNLVGPGGSVSFQTTSNEAAYYPKGVDADDPPSVVATVPANGAGDFFPATYAQSSLSSGDVVFPSGPADWVITYDRALEPTAKNLFGRDIDGDGATDPTFFARSRSTEFLVAHEVPAGALGPHAAFAAISGLEPGVPVSLDGGDVVLHDGDVLGAPSPGLEGLPSALAVDATGDLLWVVLPRDGDTDLLTLADHVMGDPSFAALATDDVGGAPLALDTGYEDLIGLLSTVDGRLIAFDRGSRSVVELRPEWERHRPTPEKPTLDPPVLAGWAADAAEGFVSGIWPADVEVLDLAEAPSGDLFVLARATAGADPELYPLPLIDPDLNGVHEAGEALLQPGADPVLAPGPHAAAVEFLGEREVAVLDRATDGIWLHRLDGGAPELLVPDVASLGLPLAGFPGGLSPAKTFAIGAMHLDLALTLTANAATGAVVRLEPRGVLPIGADVTVMQRNELTSLFGTSEVNGGTDLAHPMGAVELITVRTAVPKVGGGALIDDVFLEPFEDREFENPTPLDSGPKAHWGAQAGISQVPGLRASVGLPGIETLGDFLPQPRDDFQPDKAFIASSATQGDPSLNLGAANYRLVLLDTDAQAFPLADGSTPGVTESVIVKGGVFGFRDFIIPEGVHVQVIGSNPLRIVATGRIEIHGVLDLDGTDGLSDDTFNSGFLPVPGGAGGPGAGRGGDAHPTRFDPNGTGAIDQYVTPETAEHGFGPVIGPSGQVIIQQVGGRGGLSALGYDPAGSGLPKLDEFENREEHRSPGGGGGSYFTLGDQAHDGTGTYVVQSESTWFPFDKCLTNDKVRDALYGNDERRCAGLEANALQCVYMLGTPDDPNRFLPGGLPGFPMFADDDLTNDYIGPGGELPFVLGGQGGGGGGTRIDSMRHRLWSVNSQGSCDPLGPPFYPKLTFALAFSPTLYDAKGGAGGGGGGAVVIQGYGDIVIGRGGHITARGGHGGGGEVVQNSNFAGGGGGGSGGAVLLQAGGDIILEADSDHRTASYLSSTGTLGASIEVSGGFGRDARSSPENEIDFWAMTYDFTRSDGGQGGMGLVQLQAGGNAGYPTIEEGSYVFAKRRTVLKQGKWTDDPVDQEHHPTWANPPNDLPPDELRYIDMLHYRQFEPAAGARNAYVVLNGTHPPIIPSATGDNGHDDVHEHPPASGQLWFDTPMVANAWTGGRLAVREPEPEKVMKTYAGWNPTTFLEPGWQTFDPPGELFAADDEIPLSVVLNEPDGTPILIEENGVEIFEPDNMVLKLPLVHPDVAPAPFGTVSRATSTWLDFAGAALRTRSTDTGILGRPGPFFEPFHGTHNVGVSDPGFDPDRDGQVMVGGQVSPETVPARYVLKAGVDDPGLFGGAVPFNDLKVDAPDEGVGLENVVTDNAVVSVLFQGAYAVRPGSHVPDEATLSGWVTDLTALSGYPLVRFQVAFDLGADLEAHPFSLESMRPEVDYMRLRASY